MFLFQLAEVNELLVPLAFKTVGHQSILGTNEHILVLSIFHFHPSTFEFSTSKPIHFGLAEAKLLEDLESHIQ
jgi:hypothetical protein